MSDDGGLAFPRNGSVYLSSGDEVMFQNYEGMSLRDWFAGQALAGILANTDWTSNSHREASEFAYLQADAMLEARKDAP